MIKHVTVMTERTEGMKQKLHAGTHPLRTHSSESAWLTQEKPRLLPFEFVAALTTAAAALCDHERSPTVPIDDGTVFVWASKEKDRDEGGTQWLAAVAGEAERWAWAIEEEWGGVELLQRGSWCWPCSNVTTPTYFSLVPLNVSFLFASRSLVGHLAQLVIFPTSSGLVSVPCLIFFYYCFWNLHNCPLQLALIKQ
jgi:hypothetical protein